MKVLRYCMKIREIHENDFEQIKKLVIQVHELHIKNRPDIYNEIDPLDKEYFEFIRKDEKTIALVSERESEIIGFCIVTLREPSKNPLMKSRQVAYMEELCVNQEDRKLGIGKSMHEEAKRLSKLRGADVMELMVWSFNSDAMDFYHAMGMTERSIIMEQKL